MDWEDTYSQLQRRRDEIDELCEERKGKMRARLMARRDQEIIKKNTREAIRASFATAQKRAVKRDAALLQDLRSIRISLDQAQVREQNLNERVKRAGFIRPTRAKSTCKSDATWAPATRETRPDKQPPDRWEQSFQTDAKLPASREPGDENDVPSNQQASRVIQQGTTSATDTRPAGGYAPSSSFAQNPAVYTQEVVLREQNRATLVVEDNRHTSGLPTTTHPPSESLHGYNDEATIQRLNSLGLGPHTQPTLVDHSRESHMLSSRLRMDVPLHVEGALTRQPPLPSEEPGTIGAHPMAPKPNSRGYESYEKLRQFEQELGADFARIRSMSRRVFTYDFPRTSTSSFGVVEQPIQPPNYNAAPPRAAAAAPPVAGSNPTNFSSTHHPSFGSSTGITNSSSALHLPLASSVPRVPVPGDTRARSPLASRASPRPPLSSSLNVGGEPREGNTTDVHAHGVPGTLPESAPSTAHSARTIEKPLPVVDRGQTSTLSLLLSDLLSEAPLAGGNNMGENKDSSSPRVGGATTNAAPTAAPTTDVECPSFWNSFVERPETAYDILTTSAGTRPFPSTDGVSLRDQPASSSTPNPSSFSDLLKNHATSSHPMASTPNPASDNIMASSSHATMPPKKASDNHDGGVCNGESALQQQLAHAASFGAADMLHQGVMTSSLSFTQHAASTSAAATHPKAVSSGEIIFQSHESAKTPSFDHISFAQLGSQIMGGGATNNSSNSNAQHATTGLAQSAEDHRILPMPYRNRTCDQSQSNGEVSPSIFFFYL